MPRKSGQKRPNDSMSNEEGASCLASDHEYTNDGMDCSQQTSLEKEFPPLPITPSKPPLHKKPTFTREAGFGSDDAVRSLADLINNRSDTLEKMVESIRGDIKS